MSKNFELLQQAGITLGTGETLSPAVRNGSSGPPSPAPRLYKQEPEWLHGLKIIRKHWRLSAAFAAVVIVTVVAITLSMQPIYEPTARLEVDPPGETFSLDGSQSGSDAEYLETQAQNLKSDRLAVEVIRNLGLDRNPAFVGSATKAAVNDTSAGNIQLSPDEYRALHVFRERLKVKRDTSSRLIAVSFACPDPKVAALITNTVANRFIEDTYQDRHDEILRSSEWLSRQLDDIRGRMETSNRTLAELQKNIGVADLDNNKSTFTEQMNDLNRQLTQAQIDRIQMEALLKSVQGSGPGLLPEVRNNPVIQRLSEKLAELKAQLSQAKVVYGVNHPNVRKLENQIHELQAELTSQQNAVLNSIRTSYSAARAREKLMDSEIKGTSSELSQVARYNELKKEAEANSELYNALYAKVKEAGIAAASKSTDLRVVDPARVLDAPTRPNYFLNICAGILTGLLGGLGLAFVREQFDKRIFTPEDIRDWLGASNVAIVPQFFDPRALSAKPPGKIAGALGNGDMAPGIRFLIERPHSPEAEALRSLYTSVMLSRPGSPPQAVLVVSSFPGEGKTTVAINLAMAMAQHANTCLIDADLRRGRVAAAFGIHAKEGLSDVLNGTAPLERVLIPISKVPRLTIVPSRAGTLNAGQLVCSERMSAVLGELRSNYQFVVIDSAPLLPFADGRSLSALVDGLIFVGRSGITTRDVMRRSLELLTEVHAAPIVEFVLNGASYSSAQYRYYQYYGSEYYQSRA